MDKECKDTLYLYLQAMVSQQSFESRGEGIMSISEANWRMHQWRIPSTLKPVILKVWENVGIAKRLDRRTVQFKKTNFDSNNVGKIYAELGIIPKDE